MNSIAAFWNKRRVGPAIVVGQATALLGRLTKASFLRNVFVVMTGSAVGQAVGFALSPIISRLFTPADFGVFGSFGAVTGVFGAIVTLDYSLAVMLPRHREDAGQVFVLSCLATLAVTALCATVCLLFPGWVTGLLNARSRWLLALLALAVMAAGFNASFQAWCVRVKAFQHTAASQVVRGLSSNGLQIGFGLAHAGAPGLIISSVLADVLASLNLVRLTRADLPAFLAGVRWQRLKRLAADTVISPSIQRRRTC